ncbi:hypothetical protein B0181_03080 [Moraxella caviae]|uniref:Putative gamma-glutamylcyclotransferase n=1 Tax=Moraxella caviae TaxID=34060 RepID=A0A1T0A735_9GAMM|nr:hypothetical protein B0181_03080 [Moraxella caviae]
MNKLFVYGTLVPGRANEHWLKNIGGTFTPATLYGVLIADGWGAAQGYPAILPCEPDSGVGEAVAGVVFASDELPAHWRALDDFEGEGYERIKVRVRLDDGTLDEAWVYALRVDDERRAKLLAGELD